MKGIIRVLLAMIGALCGLTVGEQAMAQSFPCAQREAQFIGRITELRSLKSSNSANECLASINFEYFGSSKICPLLKGTASEIYLGPYPCERYHQIGDRISGVLVDDGSGAVRLE